MSPDIVIGIDDSFEDDIDEQLNRIEAGDPAKPRMNKEASMTDIRLELERQQRQQKEKESQERCVLLMCHHHDHDVASTERLRVTR